MSSQLHVHQWLIGFTYTSSLFDFGNAILWLHSITVHVDVVFLLVRAFNLGSFSSSLILNRSLHQISHLFQRSFDKFNIADHVTDFAFCR